MKEKAGKHGELAGKQLDKMEKIVKKGARATRNKIMKRVSTSSLSFEVVLFFKNVS